ncbi:MULTISPECIES: nitrilase-related carbon-nitrogen hydrolase [unclassified Acinetobacter]|uniref:nitrilase-related carbon-nitrogen hydrolase n=1 Tax=unclassified Acinetobacter TaxID=196816 RepID=UPI002574E2B7|nr:MULTISPECIES: nitrilase-related carbon-nitrogen hydrolase [unclassified Acinetobacter]MDM1764542.1 hydrolase [Acinetobacter sp. 226-1]MDM1767517.1 hydrolase [Acinetobacter sp. 226-4]
MVKPYGVVGLVPTIWGIKSRADIMKNISHLEELTAGALWLSSLDLPVRLLVLPEGALQGFNDEALDTPIADFLADGAMEIPGPETDRLGELAKRHNVFIMAQAKVKDPDWSGIMFNVGFIINPQGEIILKHHKMSALLPCERSASPHDLFDAWVEKYGYNLQSFWPVVDTEIGRLGIMMAMEGNFPENGRGLAMNGAEVVYRASLPTPFTQNDIFEISNRARALENNMYVVAPNIGGMYLDENTLAPIDCGGGLSQVIDYKGRIVGKQSDANGSTYVSGVIDIEALRYHRTHSQVSNWMKDIRSECAQLIYQNNIYPKNLYLDGVQSNHATYKEQVLEPQIQKMIDLGIWKKSSYDL